MAGANVRARYFLSVVCVPYRQQIQDSEESSEAIAAQEKAVSLMIEWRVGGDIREAGNDGANISEADHQGDTDATLQVAAQVHRVPADDDRQSGVVADCSEEYCGILGMEIVVNLEQNTDTGDAGAEREEHE